VKTESDSSNKKKQACSHPPFIAGSEIKGNWYMTSYINS
jgi:hypothetical protein